VSKLFARNKMMQNISAIVSRAKLGGLIGQQFGGQRKIYEALGYPYSITFREYEAKYKRQDIARAIVNAYPDTCWSQVPEIFENEDDTITPWEAAVQRVMTNRRVCHYFKRADRLAGVGLYSVILMGFNDGQLLNVPVTEASELLFLRPYKQTKASIHSYVTDVRDPRYGLPESYMISMRNVTRPGSTSTDTSEVQVHHSRVLHIAEDPYDDDLFGTPRLEACYNRLEDLMRIIGGSAEMFWRGGFPGMGFTLDEDAQFTIQDAEDLEDEMEKYFHGLQRYIRMQGMKGETWHPNIADPKAHVEIQIMMVSAVTGIPQRVLMGSEEGRLASGQDAASWFDRNQGRRVSYCEPTMLRPFIDRLMSVGVIPPLGGEENSQGDIEDLFDRDYIVSWPDLKTTSQKDKAETADNYSKAIKNYMDSGASALMSPFHFFTEVMGFTMELATAISEAMVDYNNEDQDLEDDPVAGEE